MPGLIRWSSAYQLRHPDIDQEHEEFVQLLNGLHAKWQQQAGREVLRADLSKLVKVAVAHFRSEEKVMRHCKYEHYDLHKADHDAFAAELLEFERRYAAGEAALDEALFDHLARWLRNHLIASDRPMGRAISRRRARSAR